MKISLITLICFFVVTGANVNAQVSNAVCTTNRNAPPASPYVWPPNSTVKVYFAPKMFTAEERQTLSAAMADWTQGAKTVGVHVSFVDAGVHDGVAVCKGCLTVMRREVYKPTRKHYAVSYSLGRERNDLLFSAMIHLDVATIDATALRGFMSHELSSNNKEVSLKSSSVHTGKIIRPAPVCNQAYRHRLPALPSSSLTLQGHRCYLSLSLTQV